MSSSNAPDIFDNDIDDALATPNAEIVAFVGDGQTHDVVHAVAKSLEKHAEVRDGNAHSAMSYLSENEAPNYLIIDLGDDELASASVFSLVTALPEHTKAIVVGTINDIGFYREILEIGVSDYLLKPLTEKQLVHAIHNANRVHEMVPAEEAGGKGAEKRNKTVVIGTRGGVGASTIAVNLAWILAEDLGLKTSLLDMDIEFGTIALSLDIEPTRGLRDALEKPERLDSLYISSTIAKLTDRLSVLATEENLTDDLTFNPEGVAILMDALSRECQCLIVDAPRTAVNLRKGILSEAGQVVVVTDYSLPSLRDCIRLLAGIRESAPDSKIWLVANKSSGSGQAMPSAEFQKALDAKVDLEIPEDAKITVMAANSGKPVAAIGGKSKMVKALQKLAKLIAPDTASGGKSETAKPWRKLMGLQ